MSGTAIEVDFKELGELRARIKRLTGHRVTDVLSSIGAEIEAQTKTRIGVDKQSPEGERWRAWSERYAKTRHSGQSLLQSEGGLLDSVQYIVESDQVSIGSNLTYARVHQFGGNGIPERPYLGLSPQNEDDVIGIVEAFFDAMVGELQ